MAYPGALAAQGLATSRLELEITEADSFATTKPHSPFCTSCAPPANPCWFDQNRQRLKCGCAW